MRSRLAPLVALAALFAAAPASAAGPRAVAAAALERGLGAGAGDFRLTTVRRSLVGTHVRGARFVDGVRVAGSFALVNLVDGRVAGVSSARGDAGSGLVRRPLGARAARAIALGRLGTGAPARVFSERLLTARGDVHRVTVLSLRPAVAATVDVAAATGRVVAVRDDRRFADAVGTVFDPSPTVTSRNPALRQPGVDVAGVDTDLDSPELTAQLRTLPIREYDSTQATAGRLVGPWAQVQGAQPYVQVTPGRFELTRGMPGFEGLMAYAHIDRYQRYLQETLGFTGAAAVNAEPQDAYALPVVGFDNSFYQPGNDLLLFGAGGVDDGEDAEVILHEYGHAMHDAQVPGWGATPEGGAMGEGFGDFQAGAYYARTSGGFQDVCIMDWDATSYSSANPPCLRRMDSAKRWPEDRKGQVHDDGELWSAYLWRLRSHLGTTEVERSDNALRLVISSHELLDPQATFARAVAALRTAAKALGRPEWVEHVDAEARVTGFIA